MKLPTRFSDCHGGDVNLQKEENSSQKILTEGRNFDSNFKVVESWYRMEQECSHWLMNYISLIPKSWLFQSQCVFQRRDLNKNPLPQALFCFFSPAVFHQKNFNSSLINPKESENTEICLQSFTRTE